MPAAEAETLLNTLPMFSLKPGLERISTLLDEFGHPEKRLRFLHIAGTNGKGSVGAMLECALRAAGFRSAFYSSPHLVEVRERFRINGRAVSEEALSAVLERLRPAAERCQASYFEVTTAAALLLFAEAGAEIVVWETGLGGRLDATNVIMPEAAVITNIALDHQKILGDTLAAIAGEKAGIIKRGVPLFLGEVPPEAEAVITAKAETLGAPLFRPTDAPETVEPLVLPDGRPAQRLNWPNRTVTLSLPGPMQVRNARLVIRILETLAPQLKFDLETALAALSRVHWPARCQKVNARLWIDGAHNPDGLTALSETLETLFPGRKLPVVFGAFADKAAAQGVAILAPHVQKWYLTPLGAEGRPSVPAAELTAMIQKVSPEAAVAVYPDAVTAMKAALAENDGGPLPVLSAGSLFLAGAILREFAPREAVLDLVPPAECGTLNK